MAQKPKLSIGSGSIPVRDLGQPAVFIDFVTEGVMGNGVVRIGLASVSVDDNAPQAIVAARLRMPLETAVQLHAVLGAIINGDTPDRKN